MFVRYIFRHIVRSFLRSFPSCGQGVCAVGGQKRHSYGGREGGEERKGKEKEGKKEEEGKWVMAAAAAAEEEAEEESAMGVGGYKHREGGRRSRGAQREERSRVVESSPHLTHSLTRLCLVRISLSVCI